MTKHTKEYRFYTLPARPAVLPTGQYHPVQLWNYILTCDEREVPPFRMAEDLKVPMDRIAYMLGGGRHLFHRRARIFAAAGR